MKPKLKPVATPLILAGLILAAGITTGCSSLSSETIPYLGAPRPAPTDPARVQILQSEPDRPFQKLGEVVISASLDPAPKIERIEAALRKRAAQLGADAVVLRKDSVEVTGAWTSGPWWSPSVRSIRDRVIVGVAIRYEPTGGEGSGAGVQR